jgi:hypothetical protein
MKTDMRKFLHDWELCEDERAKRRLAHGMSSGHRTDKPRSRYAMDFQGQGKATTGKTEALAIIDSFTKTVALLALPNREAQTLAPCLLDEIFFPRGAPDDIHTDAAPEFLSDLIAPILDATGTTRTTTCGHNALSNGEIESWWRCWNRAMKFLSPSDYLVWPSSLKWAVAPLPYLPSPCRNRTPRPISTTTHTTTRNKVLNHPPSSHLLWLLLLSKYPSLLFTAMHAPTMYTYKRQQQNALICKAHPPRSNLDSG